MITKNFFFLVHFLVFCVLGYGQSKTDNYLKDILANTGNESLTRVLKDPLTYRCQIIYTQINRDRQNRASFKNYYYNVDRDLYFNPASTVKLPLALLSLEKLHTIRHPGVNKYTPVQFDSSNTGQVTAHEDSSSESGFPSIAHYIKKAFLISDNDAYNRLYQFCRTKGY